MINLVWIGVIVMGLGFFMGMRSRLKEKKSRVEANG
jgi:cytochrome c biogenesis factor